MYAKLSQKTASKLGGEYSSLTRSNYLRLKWQDTPKKDCIPLVTPSLDQSMYGI